MRKNTIQNLILNPKIQSLLKKLKAKGIEGRLVGGCVRDALLNILTHDIDIAVAAPPPLVISSLMDSGIQVVPTGIDYGTVTAILQGTPFQLTSLRKDIRTDGRHPVVVFGSDWLEDAKRRDFTINAIYCSDTGEVFDPFKGIDDLRAGKIRFIGNPSDRIREDHLRILRYYRFLAHYGRTEESPPLDSLAHLREGIDTLSGDRVRKEILKLLRAKNPIYALKLMQSQGILEVIHKDQHLSKRLTKMEQVIECEPIFSSIPLPMVRLYVLFGGDSKLYEHRLGFSRFEKSFAKNLSRSLYSSDPRWVYATYGKEGFENWSLLKRSSPHECREDKMRIAALPTKVSFPVRGGHLISRGIKPGASLGKTLMEAKKWWAENNFLPTQKECIAYCLDRLSKK